MSVPQSFEFATATEILFGIGTEKQLPAKVAQRARRVLLVTGQSGRHAKRLTEALSLTGVTASPFSVHGEPDIPTVEEGLKQARAEECDGVVAVGGGSVLDTGKVIAAMLANGGNLIDYLEVIGGAKPLAKPSVYFAALPTTAGTGAEVTRNAVIGAPDHQVKVSIRHVNLLPALALVDPALTIDLPPDTTAASGLDAVTQLIEAFTSIQATCITDALCRAGLQKAGSLLEAYRDGRDTHARTNMCFASLCSGMALANAKLGAVHGLAGPLGGMYPAPHGAVCARLLPLITRANIEMLISAEPDSPALQRYAEALSLLANQSFESLDDAMNWLDQWCARMPVPGLKSYGVREEDFGEIVGKARNASSMKGNPVVLSDEALYGALRAAL